jgi:hypothetical protein
MLFPADFADHAELYSEDRISRVYFHHNSVGTKSDCMLFYIHLRN